MSQPYSRSEEIIDTTLELVEGRGISRLTTAALARRLGFTEAALYRYYPGKSAILAATMMRLADEVFLAMAADLALAPGNPSESAAGQLGAHVRRFTAHQGVLLDLLLTGTTGRDSELREAGNAFLEEYVCRMAAFFERLAELGLLSPHERPRELASMWVCQLLGGFVRSRLTLAGWDPEQHDGYRAFSQRLAAALPARA
jgi:AcrR family transcriptional regulator